MVLKGIDLVDRIKGIKQGDYIEIKYKDGTNKKGFYLRDIAGIGSDGFKSGVKILPKGTYLLRVEEEGDNLGETRLEKSDGARLYVVEQVKDYSDEHWVGEVESVNSIDFTEWDDIVCIDYINYEIYFKEQTYIKKRNPKVRKEFMPFDVLDWKRIIEKLGVSEKDVEAFIERVENQAKEYKGVGYVQNGKISIPNERSNKY